MGGVGVHQKPVAGIDQGATGKLQSNEAGMSAVGPVTPDASNTASRPGHPFARSAFLIPLGVERDILSLARRLQSK
jgi:hypothetical protein